MRSRAINSIEDLIEDESVQRMPSNGVLSACPALCCLRWAAVVGLILLSAAANAAEAVLPIRGEQLLTAMRSTPLPPLPQEVFLSPAGEKVLYIEALHLPPYGVGYSDRLSANPTWTLWLQDIAKATRIPLPLTGDLASSADLDVFRIGRRLAPRWSADGSQVALLEQRNGNLALLVFATEHTALATRITLPALSATDDAKESVTDWHWDAAMGQVLLGLEAIPAGYQRDGKPKREKIAWTWILSRDQVAVDGQADTVPARPNRIVAIDLRNGQVEQVYPRRAADIGAVALERERGEDPWTPGQLNWRFEKDGAAWVRLRDPIVAGLNDAKLRWQLREGDPEVARYRDARSSVYVVGRDGSPAVLLPATGVGRIASVTADSGGKSQVIVQGTAATSNWPMHGDWGELSWHDRDDGEGDSAGNSSVKPASAVMPLDSWIFAADRPGVVYQYDPLLLTLSEIPRSTMQPVALGLPGLAITHCDVSVDGTHIAAIFEGANTPPQVHVWDSRTRRWALISAPGVEWRNPAGITVEHLNWRSRDDVHEVDGFLIKPPHFDPEKRYPMLVMLAGGNALSTARFSDRFDPMYGGGRAVGGPPGAIYASAGYLVLLANHRGTEGAGVAANRAFVGQYGRHLDLDVFAGIDMLVARGWVDPDRLGVIGHSHGGDEAYYSISHSARFKAALINDSDILMPELFVPYHEGNVDVLRPWYGADIMTRMIGNDPVLRPWADPDAIRTPLLLRWAARNGPNALKRIDLGSGWDQYGVSSATTYRLLYSLRKNGVPIEVLIDQDEHQVENPKYMLELQSRLLQWFDFFVLGKGADPIPAMVSPFDYAEDMRIIEAKADEAQN